MSDHNKAREEALATCLWYVGNGTPKSHNYEYHYIDECDECSQLVAKHFFDAGVKWAQEQARYARDLGLADGYELARREEQEQARLDSVIAATAAFLDSQEPASQRTQECDKEVDEMVMTFERLPFDFDTEARPE